MKLSLWFESFAHLFFPKLCCGCDQALFIDEHVLCLSCSYHLPLTDFHRDVANPSAQQLWGKLDAECVVSMLYLHKDSRVEQLVHKLKFLDYPQIGVYLGRRYARSLQQIKLTTPWDFIVPIPLHPSKLRKRGYNQAACFGKGLAELLDIPLAENIIYRVKASPSQTTKSRLERYDNVDQVFALHPETLLEGKHVLLVDDVLTTGATLSSAGNLLKQAGAKVSVATIARA